MESIIIIALLTVAIIAFVRGFKALRDSRTATEFFLMNGKLKLPSFIGTMTASNLSLGNMIFVCAIWGYYFNLSGAFWVAITIILLVVGYHLFGKYFKEYIEDVKNNGSLHEYIASLYLTTSNQKQVKRLRYFSSMITIVTLVLAIILELHIASTLFGQVFGFNIASTFFTFLVIISAYSILGGFRTVIDTDIIQSILLSVAIASGIYFVFAFDTPNSIELNFDSTIITGTGWANSLGISFLGFGWLLVTMDTWQRNSASRSLDVSLKGVMWSGILMTIFVILFAIFGIYVKSVIEPIAVSNGLQDSISNGAFPFNDLYLIKDLVPTYGLKVALALIFIGLIMAAASTVDTFFVVIGHSFTTDILISTTDKPLGELDEKRNKLFGSVGKIVILLSSLLIMIVWGILNYTNSLNDPLSLFYIAYSVQYALLPALLLGIFMKKKSIYSAIISIIVGIITSQFIVFFFLKPYQDFSTTKYLILTADQWIGLLPLITSLVSAIAFLIVNPIILKASKNG